MKTLYLDCSMGASGDMLTGALLELLPDPDGFVRTLNALDLPGVEYVREPSTKCGITGTHVSVRVHGQEEHEHLHDHPHDHEHPHVHDHDHDHDHPHDHEHTHDHPHAGMADIRQTVGRLQIPEAVKGDVLAVYGEIAEAESHVHGRPVEEVHFHEVGALDAVADVTAVCLLLRTLAPDEVVVSPVHVGCGQVRCAHGILPVPAPATAYLLRDVPIYGGEVQGELCTPTGAALLRRFATRFGGMPVLRTSRIGYGMGRKDFPAANCVRAFLGETADRTDVVLELSCNVDDMTAEEIAFACERLFEGGAHEVYTVPIGMKKSRPGTLLRVICREPDRERILGLLFRHTSTIGVRESVTRRFVLDRSVKTVPTPCGDVRRKESNGYGVRKVKYEYDDLRRIARERDCTLDEARKFVEDAIG